MSYETQYLDLGRAILSDGQFVEGRNGYTKSLFGRTLVAPDVLNAFPIQTTRRVYLRSVFKELEFFLKGETDTKKLESRGVKIWSANTSREFLDQRGLHHYEEGDMGPMYGFAMRHFGARYVGCGANYQGQGVDQVQGVIDQIRDQPHSRRMVVTMYDPAALDDSVLMPCHIMWQVYVRGDKLDMLMYQRSADFTCGLAFNTPSYAMLLFLLASVTDKTPGTLTHVLGDVHVYEPHIEQLTEQLAMAPQAPPQLRLKQTHDDITKYKWADLELVGYKPQSKIRYSMVA